jgi:hypothetical protein
MARADFYFRLARTPRDQKIAAWLEIQRERGENVSDLVKVAIEQYIDRQDTDALQDVIARLEAIDRLIRSGVIVRGGGEPESQQDQELVNNLMGMST